MELKNLKSIIDSSLKKLEKFDPTSIVDELKLYADKGVVGASGAINDVLDKKGTGYYCWFPGFISLLKPTQIVELGGAMGVGDICMLHATYQDFKLYSITLEEHGLEFAYIDKNKYPNFVPVIGDDLQLENWPKDLDLSKTDLLFVDSEHSYNQLKAELDLYSPFLKKGTIILLDDIWQNEGMGKAWNEIKWDKFDITSPLHWTGFGICIVS